MSGSDARHRLNCGLHWCGVHSLLPVDPVQILNLHRNWRAQRFAMTQTRKKADRVLLDFHAPTTSISTLASPQVGIDLLLLHYHTSWQTFNNYCQAGSMRLTCRQKTK